MRDVILIDIDHVIAHAAPRDAMLGGEWDDYHEAAAYDKLCSDIANLLDALHAHKFYICAITSRPEKWRNLTNKWMLKHFVPIDEMIMRPNDNFMPNGELKVMLARMRFGNDLERILCVIDDNAEVINAFNSAGITCLQCFGRDYT